MGRKQGTPTGSVEYSPAKRKRIQKQRQRQEASWAAKAGPVVVTQRKQCDCGQWFESLEDVAAHWVPACLDPRT